MTVRKLDYWAARELLGLVLDDMGRDYVYEPRGGMAAGVDALCRYRDGDGPGCLVGWVLVLAGWTLDELQVVEDTTPAAIDLRDPMGLAPPAVRLWNDRTTYAARTLLADVQHRQDAGLSWGDAVDQALALMPAPSAALEVAA